MNQSIQSEKKHAQIITTLPWYVNGTLSDVEYQQIKSHVAHCAACQKEVEMLQQLTVAVQQQDTKLSWQPGPAHLQSIFNQIDRHEQTAQPTSHSAISLWQKLYNGFNALFNVPSALRWTVAVQSALVVILSVVIVVLMPSNSTPTYFETYSTEESRALANNSQIRVMFSENMPFKELSVLLSELSLTVVNGPSSRGIVTIQLNTDQVDTNEIIDMLRQNKYVEFAEMID